MLRPIRHVAIVTFVLFLALFVNLNYLQVLRADGLAADDRNIRQLIREYDTRRGSLLVGDGTGQSEIASVAETDGQLRFQRTYADPELYAHVTGYYSFVYGRAESEGAFNEWLTGGSPEAFTRNIADLLAGRERQGDDVVMTLRPAVQQAARDGIGNRPGAVVALDPSTGEVLALHSWPTYDPTRLSSHDGADMRTYWDQLQQDETKPLLNRATREFYPPGSTYKVVTAAAALERGVSANASYADPARLPLPLTTATIGNFGGGTCAGGGSITLDQAMVVSCNTTFAQLGLDLGGDAIADQAEAFGMNADSQFQLPAATGNAPHGLDEPSSAQSAIGQRDVAITPLQMAMILGAIGNDGVMMRPRVAREAVDDAGRTVREFQPEEQAQPISSSTAQALTAMLTRAVASGTGTGAQIPGVAVAGKTGTAQTGEGRAPTVWFSGFAPADNPRVAVAVVLPDGGGEGGGATGGGVAAPIARSVMQAALQAAPDADEATEDTDDSQLEVRNDR